MSSCTACVFFSGVSQISWSTPGVFLPVFSVTRRTARTLPLYEWSTDVPGLVPCPICVPSSPARYALGVGERCGGWLASRWHTIPPLCRDRTNSFHCRHLPCLVSRLIKFSRVKHQREVSLLSHSVMWFLLETQPTSVPLQSGLRFLSPLIPASPSVRLTASLPLAGSDTGLPCFVEMTR
jgi:hypothetical protein